MHIEHFNSKISVKHLKSEEIDQINLESSLALTKYFTFFHHKIGGFTNCVNLKTSIDRSAGFKFVKCSVRIKG